MLEVEWRSVPYLSENYQVSNSGLVREVDNSDSSGHILEPIVAGNQLKISIHSRSYAVHRLVADAFIPNPKKLRFVLHRDENFRNNCVSNLERHSSASKRVASCSSAAKKVFCIELDQVFGTLDTLSFVLGLPMNIVSKAIREKKPLLGFHFEVWSSSDSRLLEKKVLHIKRDQFFELATTSNSQEEFRTRIQEEIQNQEKQD